MRLMPASLCLVLGTLLLGAAAASAQGPDPEDPAATPTPQLPDARVAVLLGPGRQNDAGVNHALAAGARTRDELLDAAWDDVPFDEAPVLRFAAGVTLDAHLEKLRDEGRLPAGSALEADA